jgi:hypothetical protein
VKDLVILKLIAEKDLPAGKIFSELTKEGVVKLIARIERVVEI